MKKISLIAVLLFSLTFLFSSNILAQTKTKALVKLPVFMAGQNQTVDEPVSGDLMIAGGQIKITSNITGDVYVAGGQVDINGTIGGNLIVAGGNITLSGKVNKNVITVGGQVIIDTPAEISGYVLAGAGKVDLLGRFLGPVKIGASNLIVGEKAVINGDLEADVSKSDISSTSKIIGEKKIQIHETQKVAGQSVQPLKPGYTSQIFSFLGKLVILLVFIKLFGQKLKSIKTNNSFWTLLGLGFAVLVLTPVVAMTLLITIIGIPLSFMISGFYFTAISLSKIVVSIVIGDLISKKGYLKTNNNYLQGFVGLLLISIFSLIPFVGCLIRFIILLIGLGIIFTSLRRYFSNK